MQGARPIGRHQGIGPMIDPFGRTIPLRAPVGHRPLRSPCSTAWRRARPAGRPEIGRSRNPTTGAGLPGLGVLKVRLTGGEPLVRRAWCAWWRCPEQRRTGDRGPRHLHQRGAARRAGRDLRRRGSGASTSRSTGSTRSAFEGAHARGRARAGAGRYPRRPGRWARRQAQHRRAQGPQRAEAPSLVDWAWDLGIRHPASSS